MLPRDYFFGLYRVMAWDFWWGYTAAQIELMAIDVPLVVYGKKKKFSTPDKEDIENASKLWMEKYGDKQGEKIDLRDILANRDIKGVK